MSKYHHVKDLRFTKKHLIIKIDGEEKTFNLNEISKALQNASDVEKTTYTVPQSGYGIHWPLLDADISIDGLLGNINKPELLKLKALQTMYRVKLTHPIESWPFCGYQSRSKFK